MKKILIIRRDNIGDLVCTTPLIIALRNQLPHAYIELLVNSYNADAIVNLKEINRLSIYIKSKHRDQRSLLGIYVARFFLIIALRLRGFDWVLLPGEPSKSAYRFAKLINGKKTISSSSQDLELFSHEVEKSCSLLSLAGLKYLHPGVKVMPDVKHKLETIKEYSLDKYDFVVAVHISARKPSQRWNTQNFISLIKFFLKNYEGAAVALMWSPGSQDNCFHPGDDEKAEEIVRTIDSDRLVAIETMHLVDLIAALSCMKFFVGADGGAMHLAAGLGMPIVALFGESDPARWHPWGVPYRLFQPNSRQVNDIAPEDLYGAVADYCNASY